VSETGRVRQRGSERAAVGEIELAIETQVRKSEKVRERERKRAIDATTQLSSGRAGGNCCGGEGVSV